MNVASNLLEDISMLSARRSTVPVDFFQNPSSSKKILFCSHTNENGIREYATARGQEAVICHESGALKIRYTVGFPIRKILWSTFKPGKDDRPTERPLDYFTIVGEQEIVFYLTDDGHPYHYYVPFKVRNVYPTTLCLLVERDWATDAEYRASNHEHVYLYSLSHPLEELLPLIYKSKDILEQYLFCWEHEEMTIIQGLGQCLLVYDRATKCHRLYRVRRSVENEMRSSIRLQQLRSQYSRNHSTPNALTPKIVATPKGCTPKATTPRNIYDGVHGGGVALSVRTRSMMRLARTHTFPPLDSPALSAIGTPICNTSRSEFGSLLSFRLRSASHHSAVSGLHITRALDRDPDEELMYAEFCLECVWTEPMKKDTVILPADKAFLSRSHNRHTYLNLMCWEQQQMRSIRLIETNEGQMTTSGQMTSIQCCDAVAAEDGLTVVLEADNTLALYSGTVRSTVVVVTATPVLPSVRLLPFSSDSFVIVDSSSTSVTNEPPLFSRVDMPPAFTEQLAQDVFTLLMDVLPQEKGNRLASEWRGRIRLVEASWVTVAHPELHELFRFVLKQTGFDIRNHPKLPIQSNQRDENDVEMEESAKQRRPKNSAEENWLLALSLGSRLLEELPVERQTGCQPVVVVDTTAALFTNVYTVLAVLHSIWEEWLLDRATHRVRKDCVYYLHAITYAIKLEAYTKLYAREVPRCATLSFQTEWKGDEDLPALHPIRNFSSDQPFSVYDTVAALLNKSCNRILHTYSVKTARLLLALSLGVGCVSNLVDVHRVLGKSWTRKIHVSGQREKEVLTIVMNRSTSTAMRFSSLLGQLSISTETLDQLPSSLGLLVGKILHADHTAIDSVFPKQNTSEIKFPRMSEVVDVGTMRWPTDIRQENAMIMLDSTRPVLINTHVLAQHAPPAEDGRQPQEIFLTCSCIRYLAQAMGRAMMDFRTIAPHPGSTSQVLVRDLCLVARLFPSNMTYEIPPSEVMRPYRDWGEFYNGVAAALRIGDSSTVKVDSEWMMNLCNPNDKRSSATCAGMLYGFGLNGHIVNANMFHVHEMLASLEEFQSIGVLLGYAVAKMGSGDLQVHKMLTTQLPFLMGPTLLPIPIPPIIQSAAVAAVGLLFAQTGHLNIVKKLINEIGKSPIPEEPPACDRAAYRVNAGFAIGLICLGQGTKMLESEPPFKQAQPSVTDRLLVLLNGGPRELCVFPHQTMVADPTVTQPHLPLPPPSSHVKEHDKMVNVHLTSHPACVALGLMFLRTNNEIMGARLALPATITLLEGIRPDLILARTLCRNLIMWDDVSPSEEWIESQVPSIVMDYMRAALKWQADEDIIVTEGENSYWDRVVDRTTIAQVYIYAVTGACMALAIKFSSAIEQDKQTVCEVICKFAEILVPGNQRRTHQRVCEFAGRNVVSLCMNTMLQSLSMVMASTGDLKCLRLARLWRMHEPVMQWMRGSCIHQEQVAAHQSIGMLFMGNGRYGFKSDNRSIAMMVIAFYPIISHNVTDNRFYHQPLRFLWTQAVEQRLLVPCELRNCEVPVDCPVRVFVKGSEIPQESHGPTLLPPLSLVNEVEVGGGGKFEFLRFDARTVAGRQELEKILGQHHGRVPLQTNMGSTALSDGALDWNIRLEDIFRDTVQLTDDGGETSGLENQEWIERLTTVPNPLLSSKSMGISWPILESCNAMKMHLNNLQLNLCSDGFDPSLSSEIRMAQRVARWGGADELYWKMEWQMDWLEEQQEKKGRRTSGAEGGGMTSSDDCQMDTTTTEESVVTHL